MCLQPHLLLGSSPQVLLQGLPSHHSRLMHSTSCCDWRAEDAWPAACGCQVVQSRHLQDTQRMPG
jgi:hypothetical protein